MTGRLKVLMTRREMHVLKLDWCSRWKGANKMFFKEIQQVILEIVSWKHVFFLPSIQHAAHVTQPEGPAIVASFHSWNMLQTFIIFIWAEATVRISDGFRSAVQAKISKQQEEINNQTCGIYSYLKGWCHRSVYFLVSGNIQYECGTSPKQFLRDGKPYRAECSRPFLVDICKR